MPSSAGAQRLAAPSHASPIQNNSGSLRDTFLRDATARLNSFSGLLSNSDGQTTPLRQLLLDLGNPKKARNPIVLAIFADAQTKLRKPTNLKSLTNAIDKLDWFSAREEGLGNLYEGLLEKNASEKKSGAGQYFTPRPLIDCIVRLVQPQPGEVVQDNLAVRTEGGRHTVHHLCQQFQLLSARQALSPPGLTVCQC